MNMNIKINTLKLRMFLGKLPEILVKKYLLVLILIILINVLFSIFIFYKYDFQVQEKHIQLEKDSLILEQEVLSKIIKILDQKQQRFEQVESKTYPDLFRPQSELIE